MGCNFRSSRKGGMIPCEKMNPWREITLFSPQIPSFKTARCVRAPDSLSTDVLLRATVGCARTAREYSNLISWKTVCHTKENAYSKFSTHLFAWSRSLFDRITNCKQSYIILYLDYL